MHVQAFWEWTTTGVPNHVGRVAGFAPEQLFGYRDPELPMGLVVTLWRLSGDLCVQSTESPQCHHQTYWEVRVSISKKLRGGKTNYNAYMVGDTSGSPLPEVHACVEGRSMT